MEKCIQQKIIIIIKREKNNDDNNRKAEIFVSWLYLVHVVSEYLWCDVFKIIFLEDSFWIQYKTLTKFYRRQQQNSTTCFVVSYFGFTLWFVLSNKILWDYTTDTTKACCLSFNAINFSRQRFWTKFILILGFMVIIITVRIDEDDNDVVQNEW